MAINYETLFDLQALAGLENRIPPNVGMNLTGTPNINYLQNLANLAQQQGPTLGPDEFGSYTIPMSDPTYRSGFDYARSIAGGIPMSQVIAPGVSYSPEQPGGYTQAQLNTPVGTTPETTPTYQEPDDPSFLGTGIGGVRIPVDKDTKMPPLRDIFGGVPMQPPVQTPPAIDIDAIRQQIAESGIDFTNLFGLPKYEAPDLSQFVRQEDIPSFDPSVLKQDILMSIPQQQIPDVSKFVTQDDISKAIAGIDMPTYQAPDLSAYDTRLAGLEKSLLGLQQPTGGKFSVDQQLPMGLF